MFFSSFNLPSRRLIHTNAITHTATDNKDPPGAAIPIGNSVSAKYFDARYAPGMRTQTMDKKLCKKEIPDIP